MQPESDLPSTLRWEITKITNSYYTKRNEQFRSFNNKEKRSYIIKKKEDGPDCRVSDN